MAGTLMPWWSDQFCDANGDPLASGTVETYEAGTSTPLATYSDSALTISNGTTLTLNAGGYPQVSGTEVGVYLLPRAYKFVLKNSAGVVVRTRDNVYASQAASSSNLEIDGTAGESLSANDCCYLSDGSGGTTAGRWYKADADLMYGSLTPILAFAAAAISSGASGTFRIGGVVDTFAGLVAGSTYYVSGTAGAITATAPTNARIVGVARSATVLSIDTHLSAGFLQRTLRINAASPYTLAMPSADSLGSLTSDGSGALSFLPLLNNIAEGRLTLTSGTPVTTGDVSGATSVYYTPYTGNRIALYNGTAWNIRTFSEITIALAGLTASRPYDIFAYDNSGTVTIETLIWTSATARATAVTRQNGVWVKSGDATRRLLGTIYINASGGQTDDTLEKRNVSNAPVSARVIRPLKRTDPANSWTYTTAAYQQANANTANQVEVTTSVPELPVVLVLQAAVNNGTTGREVMVAIGEDSTTTKSADCLNGYGVTSGFFAPLTATLVKTPDVGRHTYVWLEYAQPAGTATWIGDNGGTLIATGLSGFTVG